MKPKKKVEILKFKEDEVIRNGFAVAVLFWFASAVSLWWAYRYIPPVVPFFYSMTRGANQLANKPFLVLIPVFAFALLITHALLAWLQFEQDPVFARVMAVSATAVSFIFAVALGHILFIVL